MHTSLLCAEISVEVIVGSAVRIFNNTLLFLLVNISNVEYSKRFQMKFIFNNGFSTITSNVIELLEFLKNVSFCYMEILFRTMFFNCSYSLKGPAEESLIYYLHKPGRCREFAIHCSLCRISFFFSFLVKYECNVALERKRAKSE